MTIFIRRYLDDVAMEKRNCFVEPKFLQEKFITVVKRDRLLSQRLHCVCHVPSFIALLALIAPKDTCGIFDKHMINKITKDRLKVFLVVCRSLSALPGVRYTCDQPIIILIR